MDIRKLQRVIVDGLEDVKAQDIVVFNTEHLSALFERVIVASGTSNRQTKSLAASVRDAVKAAGAPPPRTEGEENGEWIIVDCGAAVVHVMQPAIREYYHLEELWGEKPVKMKIATVGPRLVKASPPVPVAAKRAAASPVPAKRSASAPAPTKRAAASPAAAKRGSASPATAKRAAGPRTPAKTRTVLRTSGVKSAAKSPASSAAKSGAGAGSKRLPAKATRAAAPARKKRIAAS